MTSKAIAPLLAALTLTACGMPNYVPAHGQSIEQTAADRFRCKAMAEGVTPELPSVGFYAQGSQAYVAGAQIGYGLGMLAAAAVRQQQKVENFRDCMTASGYQPDPRTY